jgi:hypothetical protein
MPYDEGRWQILPLEPADPLGVPVLEASADRPGADASVHPAYVLAHVPALSPDTGPTRFLQRSDAQDDGFDLTLGEHRGLAARVGFRFRGPFDPDEPEPLPFSSVDRCWAAIFVEGRGWLGCRPRRQGMCLGWATEPRWEWAVQCLHPSVCGETVVTGAELRIWNEEAADFLVFDEGEYGPALRWLGDYQRLQRIAVGAAQGSLA